jgi:two-component system, chemotaxis family, chemotaxis protein CheY
MMNILVVDDSALMRGLVRRAIATFGKLDGLTILEADNGQTALDALAKASVDLVLLDWNMPVLDGLSFVHEVRRRGVRIPIVMISAVTDPARVMEATEAGVTDYIEKPVQLSELWERIQEHFKARH